LFLGGARTLECPIEIVAVHLLEQGLDTPVGELAQGLEASTTSPSDHLNTSHVQHSQPTGHRRTGVS
jgi:hypothetical protein